MSPFILSEILISRPKEGWAIVAKEKTSLLELYLALAGPIALIPAIIFFLYAYFIFDPGLPYIVCLAILLTLFCANFLTIVLSTFATYALAPLFGAEKNLLRATKTMVWASMPFILAECAIFFKIFVFVFLGIILVSLYSYIKKGVPLTMNCPPKKAGFFSIAILASFTIIFLGCLAISAFLLYLVPTPKVQPMVLPSNSSSQSVIQRPLTSEEMARKFSDESTLKHKGSQQQPPSNTQNQPTSMGDNKKQVTPQEMANERSDASPPQNNDTEPSGAAHKQLSPQELGDMMLEQSNRDHAKYKKEMHDAEEQVRRVEEQSRGH